jgi:hypothetical protein
MLELPKTRFICESFTVIESDPAVLTTLSHALGVQRLHVVVLCDIEPWASDSHPIYGLVRLVSKTGEAT